MNNPPLLGIIGGTGPQGRGLALRFSAAGVPVVVGSRKKEKAKQTAKELNSILQETSFRNKTEIEGDTNQEVAQKSPIWLLSMPFQDTLNYIPSLLPVLQPETLVVDVTVPLSFEGGKVGIRKLGNAPSGSACIREKFPPQTPFLGAFKTLPATLLQDLQQPLGCNCFVFGAPKERKKEFLELVERIPTLKPLDVGGLDAAPWVEGMTALVIRMNRRHKSHSGRYSIVGLEK